MQQDSDRGGVIVVQIYHALKARPWSTDRGRYFGSSHDVRLTMRKLRVYRIYSSEGGRGMVGGWWTVDARREGKCSSSRQGQPYRACGWAHLQPGLRPASPLSDGQ